MKKPVQVPSKKKTRSNQRFYTVGIGTSAGGLEALQAFFDNTRVTNHFAFVIVQHLSPDYKSLMKELLSKHTHLKMHEADHGMPVEPNNVYLIPSKKNMTIENGELQLINRAPSRVLNLPIDIFFRSLAEDHGERAIGIILSGTGSDGTHGARMIKERGGMIMVQDPATAKFDGMPKSAMVMGLIDYVLSPDKMFKELVEYISHPNIIRGEHDLLLQKREEIILKILTLLKNTNNVDFTYYKRPTIVRRISRRMGINKIVSIESYFEYLLKNREEVQVLSKEFLIGVTRFFRDVPAFELIEKKVIPEITSNKNIGKPLKLWIIGCSTGEEAYTLAMLVQNYIEKELLNLDFKLFATDIDKDAIEVAGRGIYPESVASDIPDHLLGKYFTKKADHYHVRQDLRQCIIFSHHDVTRDPPFNKIDLVVCRNMLIYMQPNLQKKVMAVMQFALNLNGYLLLGSSETMVKEMEHCFRLEEKKWRLYRNIDASKQINFDYLNFSEMGKYTSSKKAEEPLNSVTGINNTFEAICTTLLGEFGAACILTDENYEIIRALGAYKEYLRFPEDNLLLNILKLVPHELAIDIGTAVRRALKNDETVHYPNIKLKEGDRVKTIKLTAKTLVTDSVRNKKLCILVINRVTEQKITSKTRRQLDKNTEENSRINELQIALKETRKNLQTTVEELEIANEELQATNEELLASNEELQSTNEELQSVNEELHTVNTEFQVKNKELRELNDDMKYLMQSTDIGTLFLDRELCIRRFTPAIRHHFDLLEQDIGRSISTFAHNVNITGHAKEVLQTLQPLEEEIRNERTGKWFLKKVLPYKTVQDKTEGVVITFVDITQTKSVEEQLKENEVKFRTVVESISHSLITVDTSGHIMFSNSLAGETFGFDAGEMIGKSMASLLAKSYRDANPDSLLPCFREPGNCTIGRNLEVRCVTKSAREFPAEISLSAMELKNETVTLVSIVDISDRKAIEEALKFNQERLQLAVRGTNDGIWDWMDVTKDNEWWSPRFYELIGYKEGEVKPSLDQFKKWLHPDDVKPTFRTIDDCFQKGIPFDVEYRLQVKSGEYRWFRARGDVIRDSQGNPVRMSGSISDIDKEKKDRIRLQETQHFLEHINNIIPGFIYLYNIKGSSMEYTNEGISVMLGYTKEEVTKMGEDVFVQLIHPEDFDKIMKNIENIKEMEDGMVLTSEYRAKHKDGMYRWLLSQDTPFDRDEKRNATKYLGIATDISMVKEAERQLKMANEELEQLAYIAAHDLKSPISNIESFMGFIRKDESITNPMTLESIEWIEKSLQKARRTIRDLVSVVQSNGENQEKEWCDFDELCQEILEELQSQIIAEEATVETGFEKVPKVEFSKVHLRSIVYNLLSNAIKYRSPDRKPHIKIETDQQGQYVCLSVKDNGRGIDLEKDMEKVFGLFKRAHNDVEGNGLGLYMTKRAVERSGGSIEVESKVGEGTTFKVYIK